MLVTVPRENDRLVLRKVDLLKHLQAERKEYLFVTSAPATVAIAGTAYAYEIRTESSAGGLTYNIEGPAGMTVSAAGHVRWKVPARPGKKEVAVVVTVSDASGREILHSFVVRIQ